MKHELLSKLQSFQTVRKVSGQSGKFPDCLKSFQTVRKFSRESGKFPDCLESFWTVWKVFGLSGKFSLQYLNFLIDYTVHDTISKHTALS